MNIRLGLLAVTTFLLAARIGAADETQKPSPLVGTWTLVATDVLRPDGTRARDYGEDPRGVLFIDASGRYSLQIFDSSRPRFASGDKARGTADEYRAAVMGSSTHFGTITVDASKSEFILMPEGASYPNQEGKLQKRAYELTGDQLSYKVAPRPDGTIPISVWKRLN